MSKEHVPAVWKERTKKEKRTKGSKWRYLIEIILAALNVIGNLIQVLGEKRGGKKFCAGHSIPKLRRGVSFQRSGRTLPGSFLSLRGLL